MDASAARRALTALLLCVAALVAVDRWQSFDRDAAAVSAGAPEITPEIRAGGLRFAAGVPERDRAWILAAVAAARPEARALIDEIDGLVEVRAHSGEGDTIGWAQSGPRGAVISLDTGALNGDRALDRGAVVLHELAHVIDYVLVPDALVDALDGGIPRGGACQPGSEPMGACALVEERFADTFAKWALRGAVSLAGSGYGIPTPPSLEDWGAPLGRLAVELRVAAAD
jgi:hypothetical protein